MATDSQTTQSSDESDEKNNAALAVTIAHPQRGLDWATVLGLILSVSLIFAAIYIGQSNANFFNVPSILMVVLGTITVTGISYSPDELAKMYAVIGKTLFCKKHEPRQMAKQLLDLSVVARKKGVLSLSASEQQLRKEPFLHKSIQMVTDGFSGEDIERVLTQEVEALSDRHKRCSGMLRRASEVAPAMGLIGTLVGLVQMLAELDNPESIGPSMAVALLTTFYGAIMGTVILSPLAIKLDRNSRDETMMNNLVVTASTSIARQENPRRLEMLLNSDLPPSQQIKYFD